ncbi:MAG: helix-turn-helix transcriptional regulator [Proteobacteria bacterium]|nr:helix-turn-helix transcriptional regulator [Pseudomonadota bacterium]
MTKSTVGKISQTIKDKISEAGISVHAFEKKAGLKQSAVQNILYGKSKKPSLHIMQAIAQALNCTVLELMEGEDENETVPETKEQQSSLETESSWNVDLYVEVLRTINTLAKKKRLLLSKDMMLDCAEEIYEYSLKNKKNKPDKHFADWLIEKNFKT